MQQIAHGKYTDRDLERELRDIITAIKELQTGSTLSPVSAYTASDSSSSSGSSSTAIQRAGTVAVTGGSANVIAFSSAMPSNAYTLPQPRCWSVASGFYTDVGFTITLKTIYGFTITPVENATCEYLATY